LLFVRCLPEGAARKGGGSRGSRGSRGSKDEEGRTKDSGGRGKEGQGRAIFVDAAL